MHDSSLGAPVDVGAYDGPLLAGEPLHSGSCTDGTYGCRRCNGAARYLNSQQLEEIGFPSTQSCSWCRKTVPLAEIWGLTPYDEPSCYYEVCDPCRQKYNDELETERDYDASW